MNPTDLFIIYLACGAPFGVYYFLKNRSQPAVKLFWFKSFLNFLFWMPFAFLLVRRNLNFNFKGYVIGFDKTSATDAVRERNISLIKKQIEQILLESSFNISVYEFRGTIERYVGLTLAEKNGGGRIAKHERDFFSIALTNNTELGSVCLHRRNRKRLFLHQIAAREDFLHLIHQLSEFGSDKIDLRHLSIALTELSKDFEARNRLEKIFADSLQTAEHAAVKNVEQDLWKPEARKLPTARPISHLQPMKVTMSLLKKD